MVDPITLASVGGVLLTEGIKFLYDQAGALIKRWRDKPGHKGPAESVTIAFPDAFGGGSKTVLIQSEVLGKLIDPLIALRKELSEAATEGLVTSPQDDVALLKNVDAIRLMIEAIYQQRINFSGEKRSVDAPLVSGSVNVQVVLGYVAAVRAGSVHGGTVTGTATADTVASTAELVGIEVKDSVG